MIRFTRAPYASSARNIRARAGTSRAPKIFSANARMLRVPGRSAGDKWAWKWACGWQLDVRKASARPQEHSARPALVPAHRHAHAHAHARTLHTHRIITHE